MKKNVIFMTSSIVQDFCMQLHKRYVDMVNTTARNGNYNVTVVIPQQKQFKMYKKFEKYKFDDNVTVIPIFDGVLIDKATHDITINEERILKEFKLDHYDYFVYFSIFMGTKVAIPHIERMFRNGKSNLNFMTTIQQLKQLVIPAVLHERLGVKIVQIINDFYEPILSQLYPERKIETFSYYDTQDNLPSAKILDCYSEMIEPTDKVYDFSFGFTTIGPFRKYLSDYVAEHIFRTDTVNIFERNKYDESRNNPVDQEEYYEYLKKSKFTLVASATMRNRFSWFRFIEAFNHRCIPLLLEDSNYNDAKEFVDSDLYDIYKKYNLFVTYDENVNEKLTTLDYDTIWKEIESSNFIKNLFNVELNKKLFFERCLPM